VGAHVCHVGVSVLETGEDVRGTSGGDGTGGGTGGYDGGQVVTIVGGLTDNPAPWRICLFKIDGRQSGTDRRERHRTAVA